jgi:nucleotide-binding universal stress UspA family protein
MSPSPPAAEKLYLIVGYDGSAPAVRALDAATRLMRGRDGEIAVVYVAHLTSLEMMSADAIVEAQVSAQLAGVEERWRFERRQGPIAETLVTAAKEHPDAHPGDTVVIVVGTSSQPVHRMVGSVAISLARHTPVALIIVP